MGVRVLKHESVPVDECRCSRRDDAPNAYTSLHSQSGICGPTMAATH